ncbi:MAG: hypothetical protein GC191_06065 [Azospirillum sp.]|nr:hypothetical protein [Azospirillum sp.]
MNTRVLTKSIEIRDYIKRINPSKIAVAYVGIRWEDFLPRRGLKEIIVSPTLGSNPKAISELRSRLGTKNVHFLDDLHSKVFLSDENGLIGSCNLSNNALMDGRLFEVALPINDPEVLKSLHDLFEEYKQKACEQYPSDDCKRARLERLYRLRNLYIDPYLKSRNGIIAIKDNIPPLVEKSGEEKIYLAWYDNGDSAIDELIVKSEINKIDKSANVERSVDYFVDYNGFLEGDKIDEGSWLLNWRCNEDGLPRQNGTISWCYVDCCIDKGIRNNDGYTQLVGEKYNESTRRTPPFKLDAVTKDCIRDLLGSDEFCALCCVEGRPWRADKANECSHKFIDALRKEAKKRRTR